MLMHEFFTFSDIALVLNEIINTNRVVDYEAQNTFSESHVSWYLLDNDTLYGHSTYTSATQIRSVLVFVNLFHFKTPGTQTALVLVQMAQMVPKREFPSMSRACLYQWSVQVKYQNVEEN